MYVYRYTYVYVLMYVLYVAQTIASMSSGLESQISQVYLLRYICTIMTTMTMISVGSCYTVLYRNYWESTASMVIWQVEGSILTSGLPQNWSWDPSVWMWGRGPLYPEADEIWGIYGIWDP